MWQKQIQLLAVAFVLAGLLAVMAVSAGGAEASLGEDDAVAGVYDLISAAGRDLPAVLSEDSATGYKQEIIGGSITLREKHTFQWTTRYRYTEGSRVTVSESSGGGGYKVEGDEITLFEQQGSTKLAGKLTGCSLSLKADVELIYRRE